MLHLSQNFSLDLILTQVEDLTLIVFDLVNYSLLIIVLPLFLIQCYIYFTPAFYKKEKQIIFILLSILVFGGVFSILLAYSSFNIFYYLYSIQLFEFNAETATKILVDLKKIIEFIFIFIKYNLVVFLPFNLILVLSLSFFKKSLFQKSSIKKDNLLIFSYLYFLNYVLVENIAQLFLFYCAQILQLEFLILLEFFLVNQVHKKSGFFYKFYVVKH